MNTDLRTDIAELDVSALEDALDALGRPRFHARQIFQWIHKHGVVDFDAMSDLSRELRAQLGGAFTIGTPAVVQQERSVDGTVKFLLRLRDGKRIEIGLHPGHSDRRLTRRQGHVLPVDPGRVRDAVRVLPDGQNGDLPQPHRR